MKVFRPDDGKKCTNSTFHGSFKGVGCILPRELNFVVPGLEIRLGYRIVLS
jgi:hypothetical protein